MFYSKKLYHKQNNRIIILKNAKFGKGMLKRFFYKYILRRTYYKEGSCNRCGDCCSRIYVKSRKAVVKTIEEFEKLKRYDVFYSYLTPVDVDETGVVFACKNFDKDRHICVIHKRRPLICRRYPDEIIFSFGSCLSEKCGYKFIPIDSFSKVFNSLKNKPCKNYRILEK